MADNLAITAGSGTTIATDEISAVHYQKVKLAIGASDAATLLSGGAGTTDAGTVRTVLASDSVNANGQAVMASSAPVVLASNHSTLAVGQDTSLLTNGASGTTLTPKFKAISASSSGVNVVVAAVTSKKIRVLAWDLKVNAAVNFKWQSHTTPTDLTGLYYCSAQGDGVARAYNPIGYFESLAGESLDINLSGAVATGGVLTYVEV